MGTCFVCGPEVMRHGSSRWSSTAGRGCPGPVATMVPPCTCCPSTAVAGRYSPTLVRSSPSSMRMRTRSPTTISSFFICLPHQPELHLLPAHPARRAIGADHHVFLERHLHPLSVPFGNGRRGLQLAGIPHVGNHLRALAP